MGSYLLLFFGIIAIFLIPSLISNYERNHMNIDEAKDRIIYQITFLNITEGMNIDDIYTQGGKIRAPIEKLISMMLEETRRLYFQEEIQFKKILISSDLLDDRQVIDVRKINQIAEHCKAHLDTVISKASELMGPEWMNVDDFWISKIRIDGDIVGVYIIYNKTKNMYYVGQATRLFFRVNQHFTGKGNGDVYADYKYGDSFFIKLIKLTESGYDDLNKLERDMIVKYHSYEKGYNKTLGNR